MIYLSSLLFSAFTTVMLIPPLIRLSLKWNAVDAPDERKVHTRPVPRCGGVAMVLGAAVPILIWAEMNDFTRAYLIGISILVVFGSLDDFRGLGYLPKFAGQIAAALTVVLYGGLAIHSLGTLLPEGSAMPGWFSALLTVVAVVGVTNAVNLSDGLDGLAGGISLLGFCCLAFLAHQENTAFITLMAVSLAGALFGFLRFNTHPASLFMGDTGSQFLGLSAAALSISLTQGKNPLSPLLPLIILGFPILDTLTVMAERIAAGRSPFAADRSHFHHRLMGFGFSHRDAVLIIYGLQGLLILSAIFFRFHPEWVLLTGYGLFALLIVTAFHAADRRGWRYQRIGWIDALVKSPLRTMAEKGVLIRVSFRAVEFGLPSLLLFTAFLPADIPAYVSALSAILVLGLLLIRAARPAWSAWGLPVSYYLLIPFLVYFSQADRAGWGGPRLEIAQNFCYVGLTGFTLLVVKFTRRKKGFRATPLDFLILFLVAVIVPQLPLENMKPYQLGVLSGKMLVLFFAVEVVLGELRGELNRLSLSVLPALTVVAIRGFAAWRL
ncbi:MAG: undecaprenyl/decaprenyl-phosphate alpha-N-acetylglucosaminyl 1-phosphate transferase [Syntrophaceae bacterium]|nr:undecaprenyl/decaprenyl-phosphate alpha-N-acetylglucosaminyl 1-phosphate transferase [Syntrophaceae bacterium]